MAGQRWEVVQGDTAATWRPYLESNSDEPSLAGATVTMLVMNVVGTVGNFERVVPVIDIEKRQVEVEWLPGELDTVGVFRVRFRVLYDPGGPGERQETFPNTESVALVVSAP